MDSMSHTEIKQRYNQLNRKSRLTSRESTELAICEAVLFNGGKITTTRDHKETRKSGGWW